MPKWETVSGQFGGYLTVRPLPWLERRVGVPVWAKLENQQVTGSLKYRGSLYKGVPNAASREFECCLLRPGLIIRAAPNAFERWQTSCRLVLQADLEARRYDRRRSAYRGGKLLRHVS